MLRVTDGVVVLRPSTPDDKPALIALRDDRFRRFIGEGSPDPKPTFCITLADDVDEAVVGWVDGSYDPDEHTWLTPDEVNVGYALHPDVRGRGAATRSVMLLLHHLAQTAPEVRTATLAIDRENDRSLAIASRCGFERADDLPKSTLWRKPVPPLTYTDGVVTIRRPDPDDAEAHTAMIDDEQIDRLWEPGQREAWAAKTPAEELAHQRAHLQRVHDGFGTGPYWCFAVEVDGRYVGHVDADFANRNVPTGEANVSYTMAPAARGNGYVSRAVRLVLRFITEHSGAREAHVVLDPANEPSMRVARSVGARESERFHDDAAGVPRIRHVIAITR